MDLLRILGLLVMLVVLLSSCGTETAHRGGILVDRSRLADTRAACPTEPVDPKQMQEKADELKRLYGIVVEFNPRYDEVHKVNYTKIDADSMQAPLFYLSTMLKLIKIHPKPFIAKADVKFFDFVQEPTIAGDSVAGVAFFDERRLLFSIDSNSCSEQGVAETFHHELFHMFHNVPEPPSFNVSNWLILNGNGFVYPKGSNKDTTMNHPIPGFVSNYASVDETEDSAETFTAMVTPEVSVKLKGWVVSDSVLAAKSDFLKNLLSKISPEYTPAYWQKFTE